MNLILQTEAEYQWAILELEKLRLLASCNPHFKRLTEVFYHMVSDYELSTPQEVKPKVKIARKETISELAEKLGLVK